MKRSEQIVNQPSMLSGHVVYQKTKLMEFRSEREFRVDELLHKIMKIWDLLCVDESTREIFKDENYGLREDNVKKVISCLQPPIHMQGF